MTDEDVATIFNHKPTGLTGSGDAVGQHLFAQEPALASTPVLVETASTGND
jgi:hypothetical protein